MDMCAPLSSVFCMKFACTHSRHIGYMKSVLLAAEPSCQDAEWIFFVHQHQSYPYTLFHSYVPNYLGQIVR